MKKYKFFLFVAMIAAFLGSCQEYSLIPNNKPKKKVMEDKELVLVKNVNVEIAQAVANKFIQSVSKVGEEMVVKEVDSIPDWDGNTALYVFNFHPTGYVFTSADISNEPIIGYSIGGNIPNIDELPSSLLQLLEEIIVTNRLISEVADESETTSYIITDNIIEWGAIYNSVDYVRYRLDLEIPGFDPCAHAKRELVSTHFSDPEGYLCKTSWGQDAPYNYYMEMFNGKRAPAGCDAIALSQVMKYHSFPSYFNWNIMPNHSTNFGYVNMTDGEYAVAKLIEDVGKKIGTKYGAEGSSSTLNKVIRALKEDYNYSSEAILDNWDYNRIIHNIENGLPVIARGDGTEEVIIDWGWLLSYTKYSDGHAYLMDGVQYLVDTYEYECLGEIHTYTRERKLLHYNFGWYDFLEDGWFSSGIIDIPDTYDDKDWVLGNKTFPNFKYRKKCIYNIKKIGE